MMERRKKRCDVRGGGPSLTSDVVEDVLCFRQFFLHLGEAGVEKRLHPVDLLLHQAAAARRLVRETNWTHKRTSASLSCAHTHTHTHELTVFCVGIRLVRAGARPPPGVVYFLAQGGFQQTQQDEG